MTLTILMVVVLAAGWSEAAPDFRHRYALPPALVPPVQPWYQYQHRDGASYAHGYQVPSIFGHQVLGSPVVWQQRYPVAFSPVIAAPAPASADPHSPSALGADAPSVGVQGQQVVESPAFSLAVRQDSEQAQSEEEDPADPLVFAAQTLGQQVFESPTFNLAADDEYEYRTAFSPLLKFAAKAGVLHKIGRTPSGTEQYAVSPELAERAGGVSALAHRLNAVPVAAVHDVQLRPGQVDPKTAYAPVLLHREEAPRVTLYTLEVHDQ